MPVPVRTYSDLIRVIDDRRRELGWSCLELDYRSGLQDGYSAKIICGRKHLGRLSFGLLTETLGIRLLAEPVTEQGKAA